MRMLAAYLTAILSAGIVGVAAGQFTAALLRYDASLFIR